MSIRGPEGVEMVGGLGMGVMAVLWRGGAKDWVCEVGEGGGKAAGKYYTYEKVSAECERHGTELVSVPPPRPREEDG